ncbi:TPR-like protein [Choiromyces venosus 120613-1]|uniref:TPR-like protein n=1 Tax=Choiromyces venosus 120613-1 TaxID=1336337 RepID=A0A3N4K175_9PEZI|nr:TPR-like protein [Choiromyces venosus 120613-1]
MFLAGALKAYGEALKLDPNNAQAKSGVKSIQEAMARETQQVDGADLGMGNLFKDPQFLEKLARNPRTSAYLGDMEFMEKLERFREDPNLIQDELRDPRIMQVIAALLGLQMEMGDGAAGPGGATKSAEDTEMPDASGALPPKKSATPPSPEPADEEAKALKEAKEAADKEKALGNENYKKRNFDAAIEHYNKAWELHKDITYLNNLAAAKFEAGDYEGCIKECEKAIEEGREIHADFKLVAKAFGRIGTAHQKLENYPAAIDYYQRSLTEHRTPDILLKLRGVEKMQADHERLSYIDPAKAEEARESGNAYFKSANWPEAVKSYTEMIKRAPEDPRGYTNRAAALTKLMSFPEAVRDCDEAIKRDSGFMRAHIRKAQACFAMREYNKCLEACNAATEADKESKHSREIEELTRKAMTAMYSAREGETEEQTMERIQKDPEIVAIISDPVMQSILQQAKRDPAALTEHMKSSYLFLFFFSGVMMVNICWMDGWTGGLVDGSGIRVYTILFSSIRFTPFSQYRICLR